MRLFFGLPLPDDVRAALAEYALLVSRNIPGRYALPENYHLTLAFLGEVPQARLPEAEDILRRAAAAFPAPTLRLGALDHFGRAENAIMILRAQAEPALEPLHAALVGALVAEGLPHDPGPFAPHITLARHAQMAGAKLPPAPEGTFSAPEACVFLSARDEADALRYTPLSRHPFGQTAR